MNSIKTVTLRLALTSTLCAGSVGLLSSPAAAAPGWSWNLSRDMMTDFSSAGVPGTNPLGAWEFMESAGGCLYQTLPDGDGPASAGGPGYCWGSSSSNLGCWYDSSQPPVSSAMVGMSPVTSTLMSNPIFPVTQGVPILHPGQSTRAAVRWTNQLGQPVTVNVLGRFTHVDPWNSWNLADGVKWYVYHNSPCSVPLATGRVQSTGWSPVANDSDVFSFNMPMNPGDELYFVVDRGGNYYYDSTELDVLIVAQ